MTHPPAEPNEETADVILQHVPEVIKRAKQMRSLAEKTRFSAKQTTVRAEELRRDAAAKHSRLGRTMDAIMLRTRQTEDQN